MVVYIYAKIPLTKSDMKGITNSFFVISFLLIQKTFAQQTNVFQPRAEGIHGKLYREDTGDEVI